MKMVNPSEELAFLATKEKTAREEATAAERNKRAAEIEEMRRRRAEADGGATDFQALRARLANKSAQAPHLTTDLESWRANQKNAAVEDRKKKLEANKNLHDFRGKGQVIPKRESKFSKYGMGPIEADNKAGHHDHHENGEHHEGETHERVNEEIHSNEHQSHKEDGRDDAPDATQETNKTVEEGEPAQNDDPPAPVVQSPIVPPKKPTYSRVDVKFSFGLIVRSNESDGVEGEDLRNNETLRKCMDATAKILVGELPTPPDDAGNDEDDSIAYPDAYYDPNLTPTVISIEEDKKEKKPDEKEQMKGTKRTLVKASFPVFLKDEAKDELGKRKSSKVLKQTKTTVFKSLRAAVSGGSFLR